MFILLLLLPISAFSFLFPTGNSCGCSPCATQSVCPTVPVCPAVPSCPQTVAPASCCPTCSCRKRQKRDTGPLSNGTFIVSQDVPAFEPQGTIRLKRDVLDEVVKVNAKCNSEQLREIIIQNMDRVTSVTKKRIQAEAESKMEGRYNVICARGDFSYITNTEKFCQETVGDVTCYVFKQLSDVVRARLK